MNFRNVEFKNDKMETLTQLIVKPKNVSMLLYHLSLGVSCKLHSLGKDFF